MTGASHLQLDTPSVARLARFSRALGSFGATFAMVMAVDGRDERRMVANVNVEKLASHEHLSLKQAHNAMLT